MARFAPYSQIQGSRSNWRNQRDRHRHLESEKGLPASARYSVTNRKGKAACKTELQKEMALEVKGENPLFGVVSRLYRQKGLDLLAKAVPGIMETTDAQVVLLGIGDKKIEKAFKKLAKKYPDRVGIKIGFSNQLAHRIYAGSDFFIMPSRFEPCGLSQMYAMRYGTPPIARATGGLIDTIVPHETGNKSATGLMFTRATPEELGATVEEAASLYKEKPTEYRRMQSNGMKKDFSWKKPASAYENIYRWAVEARKQAH